MTQQNAHLRQDQPIEIGPRHGYSIECDHASINAELQVPPHHSGGEWMLELWATDHTYQEGPLTGLKIAEVPVALPTPIGPYLHQVDARIPARLPPQGRAYSMVLALVRRAADGQSNVDAFANYAEPQTFIAPHFAGQADYRVDGQEVVLTADGIANPRIEGNVSGTLSLKLWAFPESGASSEGQRLASAEIGSISGEYWLQGVERRVAFSEPPVGRHRMALLLCEWTVADGYVPRDRRDLASIYERPAPEPVVPSPAPVASKVTVGRAPVASKLTVAAKVTAAAAAPVASDLVSIQTASVDELAKVKGLNLKIAKAIVKARPFTSLADLIRVPGIGDKTVERLKRLLTL